MRFVFQQWRRGKKKDQISKCNLWQTEHLLEQRNAPPVLRRSPFSGVAEEVNKDAVSLVCQGIRDFVGCESHRRRPMEG